MPVINCKKLIEERSNAIRSYHATTINKRAQLDVSGGIDSSVMLGLLVNALTAKNITAVYSGICSSDESYRNAKLVSDFFNVKLITIFLTDEFWTLVGKMFDRLEEAGYLRKEISNRAKSDQTIYGSIRSCLRAPLGRGFNRLLGGGLRHGTGNECEDRWLRFYQKGGDGEVDTNPISILSKGEVYQLGVEFGIPKEILTATPSHDLHDGEKTSSDEEEIRKLSGLNWTYSKVDPETGKYTKVGTIERMSRFLDDECIDNQTVEKLIFNGRMKDYNRDFFINVAKKYFPKELKNKEILSYIYSAINIEKKTRHKYNPNCLTLGTRKNLIKKGIVTNEFPKELL